MTRKHIGQIKKVACLHMVDKLNEIENLGNGSSINISRLIELSCDSDAEIRFRAFEAFEKFVPTKEILTCVRGAVNDKDELVRSTCIELLGDWRDWESIEKLYSALSDGSEFVRSAAITSLGQIGKKDTIVFLEGKFPEFQGVEKVSAAMALYSLGKIKYLDDLMLLLNDDDYRIRCAVANLVCRFIDDNDKAKFIEKMELALSKEKTEAAASSLSNAITELESD